MTFDGITTKAVIDEIKDKLIGGKINKINQINKDTIIFRIYNKKNTHSLFISTNPSHARIHLTENKYDNPQVPPDFCMLLRKHLQGGSIIDIKQVSMDRTIIIKVSSYDEMGYPTNNKVAIELMGRHSNLILMNDNNIVYDSIRRVSFEMSSIRQILPNSKYEIFTDEKENILKEYKEIDELNIGDLTNISKIFYKNYTGFSPIMGIEIAYNANLEPDRTYGSLNNDEKNRLNSSFNNIVNMIRNKEYSPTIYIQGEKYENVYSFNLNHLPYKRKEYPTISKALDSYYKTKLKSDQLGQGVDRLNNIINNRLKSESKKFSSMIKQYEETKNIDEYKNEADLLSGNIYKIKKGDKEVIVKDYYTGEEKNIKLDPRISPWDNVEKKYKKVSKLKKTKKFLDKSLPILNKNIDYLNQIKHSLTEISTMDEFYEIEEELENVGLLKRKKKKKNIRKKENSRIRHYIYKNHDIYVGKNNKQNDELTFKKANKDDFFLHAKGVPGAHVILRSDKNPDDHIKYVAAWLAAVHSSESNSNIVQVDITEKKNVNKAKGAQAGMVYYTNYETIDVDTSDSFDFDNEEK